MPGYLVRQENAFLLRPADAGPCRATCLGQDRSLSCRRRLLQRRERTSDTTACSEARALRRVVIRTSDVLTSSGSAYCAANDLCMLFVQGHMPLRRLRESRSGRMRVVPLLDQPRVTRLRCYSRDGITSCLQAPKYDWPGGKAAATAARAGDGCGGLLRQ